MSRFALALLGLGAALALPACGGSGGDIGDAEEIRAMIEAATNSDDPSSCRRFNTLHMVEESTGEKGEEAFRACEESGDEGPEPADDVKVPRIEVEGDRATVDLAFVGSVLGGQMITYVLVEEDGQWKFDESLSFVDLDRDRLLLEWARALYEEARTAAETDRLGCAIERVERFSDAELERLFLRPDPEVLVEIVRVCETRGQSI